MPGFDDIYDQYADRIYRICRGYLYDQALVDDLFQDVMTNIWQGLKQFRGDAQLSTWIYRVTVNTAITYNRQTQRERKRKQTSPLESDLNENESPPEEFSHSSYSLPAYRALHDCIHQLDDQDRLIISLVLEELSYRDIADIVGISVNYVGVKISRIKSKLAHCIPDHLSNPTESHHE